MDAVLRANDTYRSNAGLARRSVLRDRRPRSRTTRRYIHSRGRPLRAPGQGQAWDDNSSRRGLAYGRHSSPRARRAHDHLGRQERSSDHVEDRTERHRRGMSRTTESRRSPCGTSRRRGHSAQPCRRSVDARGPRHGTCRRHRDRSRRSLGSSAENAGTGHDSRAIEDRQTTTGERLLPRVTCPSRSMFEGAHAPPASRGPHARRGRARRAAERARPTQRSSRDRRRCSRSLRGTTPRSIPPPVQDLRGSANTAHRGGIGPLPRTEPARRDHVEIRTRWR